MKWSEQAKQRNRARRMARRLHRKIPLFAFREVTRVYPEYSIDQYLSDIKHKTKKMRGKRISNGKRDYLEHIRMQVQNLIDKGLPIPNKHITLYYIYEQTKGQAWAVYVKLQDKSKVFYIPKQMHIKEVKDFVNYVNAVKEQPDSEQLVETYYSNLTRWNAR